jgi:hypothetical protein
MGVIHPPSMVVFIMLSIVLTLFLKIDWKQKALLLIPICLSLILIGAIPFFWVSTIQWGAITESGKFFLPPLTPLAFLLLVGFLPTTLLFYSIFLMVKGQRLYVPLICIIVVISLFLLMLTFIFTRIFEVQALFDRTIVFLLFLIFFIAGWALKHMSRESQHIFSLLVFGIIFIGVVAHANTPISPIITNEECQDFLWIKENLNDSYSKAIMDPVKAMAFTPLTRKQVFIQSPLGVGNDQRLALTEQFLTEGCNDTSFLIANGITVVYTHSYCDNPDLVEVQNGIYIIPR